MAATGTLVHAARTSLTARQRREVYAPLTRVTHARTAAVADESKQSGSATPKLASTPGCVVVVGVGPALGLSVAQRFAKAGYKVGVISRKLATVEAAAAAVTKNGGTAMGVPADASDEASLRAGIAKVVEAYGPVQVLVYNVGPGFASWPPPSILDLTPTVLTNNLKVGCVGALTATQAVVPAMLEAGHGTIIFTGATAAMRGGARFAGLAVPKFGLRALSQSIAREFQPKGIHCAHVIVDGQIRSSWTDGGRDPNLLLDPDAIAEAYFQLHIQHPSAWVQEMDMRPFVEKF